MASHKLTFEFQSTVGALGTSGSNAGWTESWYRIPNETLSDMISQVDTLRRNRVKLLTPGWSLTAARISNLDANNNLVRKGTFVFYPPADAPGTYSGDFIDEQPYDACEVRIGSALGYQRAFSMRGIGANVINAGARLLNPAQFNNALTAWKTILIGAPPQWGTAGTSGWAIRYRTKFLDAKVTAVDIVNTPGIGGTPQAPMVGVDGNVGLVAGQTVVLSRILGMQNLNGSWIVKSFVAGGVGGPSFWLNLQPKRRTIVDGVYQPSGRAISYGYLLDQIIQATAEYGTSRRTGRPSQLTRGRRSNRGS